MAAKNKIKIGKIIIFIWALCASRLFAAAAGQPEEAVARPQEKYAGEGLRDPFESYIQEVETFVEMEEETAFEPKKPLPAFAVQGIIRGERFNQAIINDKVVKIGDVIEEARVTDINKQGVILFFNNKYYPLPAPELKKPQDKQGMREGGLR